MIALSLIAIRRMFFLFLTIGLVAGAFFLWDALNSDSWSPRQYVPAPGDCWVPPQGDPLYDREYSEINQNNCKALESQERAQYTEEQTRALSTKTDGEAFAQKAAITAFVLVLALLSLLVVAMVKGTTQ